MTRPIALLILALSLSSVAASQILVKSRIGPLAEGLQAGQPWLALIMRALSDPLLWLGGCLVVIGAACWYVALSRLPLNLMLPLASLMAPAAAIGAHLYLGEQLSLPKMAAILVITAGVAWLGWLNA